MASLTRYLIRRAIQGVITLLIVTVLIFILFYFSGNPLDGLRSNPSIQPAVIERLRQQYGLDQGPEVQLYRYVVNMFTFNFGWSSYANAPVVSVLQEALPRTLFLFGGAVLIEYALGVLVGRYIAWKRGRGVEGGVIVTSLFFYNMPSFWIGLILLFFFAFVFDWFPLRGFTDAKWTSAHLPWAGAPGSIVFQIADVAVHGFLPMLALVLISSAGTILLMPTSMLDVMGEDFILTARAKGLSERVVRKKHAARNAYLPVVTSLAISLGYVVGGAIILEYIFSYYGLGSYLLIAIISSDRFLAGSILFLISVLVIFGNIVADILYGALDPRVRI